MEINKCKHGLTPELVASKNFMGDWRFWLKCNHIYEPCSGNITNSEDLAYQKWNENNTPTREAGEQQ